VWAKQLDRLRVGWLGAINRLHLSSNLFNCFVLQMDCLKEADWLNLAAAKRHPFQAATIFVFVFFFGFFCCSAADGPAGSSLLVCCCRASMVGCQGKTTTHILLMLYSKHFNNVNIIFKTINITKHGNNYLV
jgi:hypothetical protein